MRITAPCASRSNAHAVCAGCTQPHFAHVKHKHFISLTNSRKHHKETSLHIIKDAQDTNEHSHATQPRNHTTTHATIAHVSAHTIINICADAVYLNDSKFRSFNDDIANVLNSFDRSKVLQQREGGGGRERMLGIHKIRGKSVRKTSKTQEY